MFQVWQLLLLYIFKFDGVYFVCLQGCQVGFYLFTEIMLFLYVTGMPDFTLFVYREWMTVFILYAYKDDSFYFECLHG